MRLTRDMRRQLAESAAQNSLSLQAEIIRRLDQSLKHEAQMLTDIKAIDAKMDEFEARLEKAQAEMWTPLPKLGEQYIEWVKRITTTKK